MERKPGYYWVRKERNAAKYMELDPWHIAQYDDLEKFWMLPGNRGIFHEDYWDEIDEQPIVRSDRDRLIAENKALKADLKEWISCATNFYMLSPDLGTLGDHQHSDWSKAMVAANQQFKKLSEARTLLETKPQ